MNIISLCFEDVYHPTGGMGVHCRDLALALGKLGHTTTIITIASEPPAYGIFKLSDNVEVLKIENKLTYKSDVSLLFHFLMEQNFLMNVLDQYGRNKFDIIHCHDSHLWTVAESLRCLWKIPIVYTSHLSPLLHNMRFATDTLAMYKNQLEGTAFCNADVIITISEYYRKALKDSMLGINSIVIPNGVDIASLRKFKRDKNIREKYGGGKNIITLVARPVHNKGVELFIEAAEELRDFHFVYVGYLPPAVEKHYPLAKNIRQAESLGNFTWLNNLPHEDKWELMASSDMGCVPSLYEPFGIVALEWMALGVPLITTGTGGLAEFCDDGNCDLTIPTTKDLTSKIKNHNYNRRKVEKAVETAQSYSWGRAAEATQRVYNDVVR